MLRFIKNVLASTIGVGLFFVLIFVVLLIFGTIAGGSELPSVEKNSVIELDLSDVSKDYAGKYTDPLITMLNEGNSNGLTILLRAIEIAKTDDKIKGIALINSDYSLGAAQAKALRDQLLDFKQSKKFVVSYADYYTQSQYYINSVADTVYLNPLGMLDLKGLSTEVMYSKKFQDQSGIEMQVIRHGKYKSAAEGYLDDKMSDENKEQLTYLLNGVWDNFAQDIAKSRKLTVTKINEITHNLNARTPELALENKLIDKIAYEDEVHAGIKKALKVEKDKDYKKISLNDYATANQSKLQKFKKAKDYIAVIYAQGVIMPGEGSIDVVSEGAMNASLKKAREDKNVKAIVIRVDSPGGSALTSDIIWREIEQTKKVKPVVVSMGNLAASGGYYIACNANRIFAESNTITGSIGVFGTIPNVNKLAEKWGFNAEQVGTHDNSVDFSLFEKLSPKTEEVITESIENIYDVFLTRVATGRNMTKEEVNEVAQGRVWTGDQALERKLIDEIGGLQAAITHAAKLGKTKEFKITSYPIFDTKFNFSDFLPMIGVETNTEVLLKKELGAEAYRALQQVKKATQYQGIQALMPLEIKF